VEEIGSEEEEEELELAPSERFWDEELNVKAHQNFNYRMIVLIGNYLNLDENTIQFVSQNDFEEMMELVCDQEKTKLVLMKMKITIKAVYKKYQMDLNQTVVQEKSFSKSINNSTMLQVQSSKKDWLSALPAFNNAHTSERIYLLLDKLETILDSFEVDVDRNWKTAVKFMGSNLHGSKQAALKNLNGSKLWSKETKEEIVNVLDPIAVATNWNKRRMN
jgi:hypothetical protein